MDLNDIITLFRVPRGTETPMDYLSAACGHLQQLLDLYDDEERRDPLRGAGGGSRGSRQRKIAHLLLITLESMNTWKSRGGMDLDDAESSSDTESTPKRRRASPVPEQAPIGSAAAHDIFRAAAAHDIFRAAATTARGGHSVREAETICEAIARVRGRDIAGPSQAEQPAEVIGLRPPPPSPAARPAQGPPTVGRNRYAPAYNIPRGTREVNAWTSFSEHMRLATQGHGPAPHGAPHPLVTRDDVWEANEYFRHITADYQTRLFDEWNRMRFEGDNISFQAFLTTSGPTPGVPRPPPAERDHWLRWCSVRLAGGIELASSSHAGGSATSRSSLDEDEGDRDDAHSGGEGDPTRDGAA